MKIILSILLAITHFFAPQSVLNQGNWVKIRVQETGVHKLTFAEIRNAGIDPNSLCIYGYGGAQLEQSFNVRMLDDLCSVPYYKGNDYILFYAQGNISWSYNGSAFSHIRNTYSDYGYYFLTDNVGTPVLLNQNDGTINTDGATAVNHTIQLFVHDEDYINLMDVGAGQNGGGRTFYGEQFNKTNSTLSVEFPTHNLTSGQMRIYADVAAYANLASTFKMEAAGKSTSGSCAPWSDHYTRATEKQLTLTATPQTNGPQTVKLTYSTQASSGNGYLNYIELTAESHLSFYGSQMPVRTKSGYQSTRKICYNMSDATACTMVWDVTNLDSIRSVVTYRNGTNLSWTGSNQQGIRTYVAIDPTGSFPSPEVVGSVPNQNLHALSDIDMVIITPAAFAGAAQVLADKHDATDNLICQVVTTEQIYNEFSSGTPDATAYRRLMKMLYDRANAGQGQRPQYLLLFGDGTFDNRKLLRRSGNNWILTYQSKNSTYEVKAYACDDYFGFLDNNEGENDASGRMDISVGRLPVNTEEEAYQVVNKICRYMDNLTPGQWKQQITFLADDGDNGTHTITSEDGAERVRLKNPSFVINKIYLDAYTQETSASGESYPVAYTRFHNALTNGTIFLDYSGHGGFNSITNESMLSLSDTRVMRNTNQAFWMMATCSFAHFDSGIQSCAEVAVNNPEGGAIGVLSACRTVYATQNTNLNRQVCDTLFAHSNNPCGYGMTIGKATSYAKNAVGSEENKLAYILLGDPALKLNFPTHYQVITSSAPDTVRALSTSTITGYIADADNQPVSDFNGSVVITIYDKMQVLHTQDNDETDPEKRVNLRYNDYPNRIYRGEADVVDGQFTFSFITPKDIRYNYGNGRIVYYALDTLDSHPYEAIGHYEDFIIGGSNPTLVVDTIGPDMRLYLNDPLFRDYNVTHENPHFYAELSDPSGINTVGSGIGHDLMLTVDNKVDQIYILNDYFSNSAGSHTDGLVSFVLPKMEDGQHVLRFRAWDMCNNSTTDSLHFQVIAGQQANIIRVVALPNPVGISEQMAILINEDRPDDTDRIRLSIFDMQGRLVYETSTRDERIFRLTPANIGMKCGLYTFRVSVRTTNNRTYVSKTGKLIVK